MNTTTTDSTFTRVLRLGLSATIFIEYRRNNKLDKAKKKQKQYLTSEEIHYKIVPGSRIGPPHQDDQDHGIHVKPGRTA